MNRSDVCKLLVLIPLSPLIGCAVIIYGVVFPIVLVVVFFGYIIYHAFKK